VVEAFSARTAEIAAGLDIQRRLLPADGVLHTDQALAGKERLSVLRVHVMSAGPPARAGAPACVTSTESTHQKLKQAELHDYENYPMARVLQPFYPVKFLFF
jgi:hypothetical protein